MTLDSGLFRVADSFRSDDVSCVGCPQSSSSERILYVARDTDLIRRGSLGAQGPRDISRACLIGAGTGEGMAQRAWSAETRAGPRSRVVRRCWPGRRWSSLLVVMPPCSKCAASLSLFSYIMVGQEVKGPDKPGAGEVRFLSMRFRSISL